MPSISRRRVLELAGGVLASISLGTACAPGRQSSTPRPGVAATPGTDLPRKGGTLAYGQSSSIASTRPYPSDSSRNLFKAAMFNPLVSLDDRKQPVPVLAESWSSSPDRLTLTFKLRQGVLFHSGRPFTAEDAKWSIEYTQDLKNGAQSGAELQQVQVRAIDSATLELRLPDVMPHIYSLLTDVMMMDPASDITTNAAGTGAFRLDSLTPGVEMRLVRNERYWRADRPYLQAVTIKNLSDLSSGIVDLESGALDMVAVRDSDVRGLQAERGFAVAVVPSTGNYEFLLNTADTPFNDKRVRQAIDLSLDRKRFSETLLYGLAAPTYIMWPRSSPVWDAALDVGEFNLDKARQLLESAGYGNGFQTTIQASATYGEEILFDEVVQSDLAKIGINASIEKLDSPAATAVLAQASFPAMFAYAYALADADPAMAFTNFVFRPSGNASRFESDEYTMLVAAARREPDVDRRIGLYRQIGAFVKDQAFVLPLANSTVAVAMHSNIHGFVRHPLFTVPLLEELWMG